MKALKNHLILFDAECWLCKVSTKTFVTTGMLDPEGRAAYQDLPAAGCPMLDRQRAVDEIALVNQETGEVSYGVESLFKVFAASFPVLKPLFLFRPFIWVMTKLYALIAFNRRVIVPPSGASVNFTLQPSFRLSYRIAYLILTLIITASVLAAYTPLLKGALPHGNLIREYMICAGQILVQGYIFSRINEDLLWDYLGNLMSICSGGTLLLLPALLLAQWLPLQSLFYAGWFSGVAGLMFLEHMRRSKLLNLGQALSFSWLLYWMLVLLYII